MADWQQYLNQAEIRAWKQTEDWCQEEPGLLSKMSAWANIPFNKLFGVVPAKAKATLSAAINTALVGARKAASYSTSYSKVTDELSAKLGFDVAFTSERIYQADIQVLDAYARQLIVNHCRGAALEGGVSGSLGVVGFVGDIPALYTLVYRLVYLVGMVYGFASLTEAEDAFVLKVIDVGHYIEDSGRREALRQLTSMSEQLATGGLVQDAKRYASAKTIEALAWHLAGSLWRRKAAQTVAVVGSAIAAGVNYQLLHDIGIVAFHAYRRRFIEELGRRRMAATTRLLGAEEAPSIRAQ